MKKFTAEQRLFLEHLANGLTVRKAATAIGRSYSAPYGWARNDRNFAEQFAAVCPKFRTYLSFKNAGTVAAASSTKNATISLHQLAMQRLEREVRTDGPNAVLASAAIVLISPQAIATETPAVEGNEDIATPIVPEAFQLLPIQNETPSMTIERMMDEVFPLNAPCTYLTDTRHVRRHLEHYYNCDLGVKFRASGTTIAIILRKYLESRFSVAFEPDVSVHTGRLYSMPQPKTQA